jgi:valyl-tRNA synthetase
MDKSYSPLDIERRIYERWESSGLFAPAGDGAGYCIVIPPPNVTGTLHMGHAFQDTIMDALTRYHRMRGEATLWQPGTDHAGIATQMVVERQLEGEGSSRAALGRDAFIERVWKWKGESGGTIARQMRRLGASVDWSRDRFTMDEGLSQTVTEVFVRLYEEGLIYRGKRLVNWDPVLQTAVSDLEVLSSEEDGSLWHLRYPLVDGSGHLVVATTRPETMLGDTAVAVHPDDERYRHLIGQQLRLPLTDRTIPIIGDTYVDPEFGSGCVKITPAHDFNDNEVGLRHQLAVINVFTPDAKINENAPAELQGLDRFEARARIIEKLTEQNLLERIDKHKLMVPRGDRSGSVIEPYLTDQWYVKIAPLAEPAVEAVTSGKIKFVPENWSRTYFEWMRNIKDWCISRQLWWGHRIPAWYDDQGHIYVGRSEAEVRAKHALAAHVALKQDDDVLDTWFSSALWPFSTLGWPQSTSELQRFYPTSVLVTGFDIIFFWVARMIMMGMKFMGDVPFREVYVHGLVRDSEGQKMSKSKGNVLDPLDIVDGIALEDLVRKRTTGLMQPRLAPSIEKSTRKAFPDGIESHGTDALRFTFASLATQSADIRFDLARVGGYRNFCNKLWNASRFVLLMLEDETGKPLDPQLLTGEIAPGVVDRWIVSRLGHTLREVDQAFADYRFDYAASALYEFTWYEFCDWYLELAKPILQSEQSSDEARRAVRRTLVQVLEALLRALHPLMPFITEEIWQRVAPLAGTAATRGGTLMTASWPSAVQYSADSAAEADVDWIKAFVLGIRQIRGEMDISPSRKLGVLIENASADDRRRLDSQSSYLARLAGLESLRELVAGEVAPPSALAVIGDMRAMVPMEGLIDPQAEVARLEKRAAKTRDEIQKARNKLANENFVRNAPPEVVTQEQGRVADFERTLASIDSQLQRVRALLK